MKRESMIYHSFKNISEFQKDIQRLEAIADTLYETGCEPKDFLIFQMRSCLKHIEEFYNSFYTKNKLNLERESKNENQTQHIEEINTIELKEIRRQAEVATKEYKESYLNRLIQLLRECGMHEVDVRTEHYGEILVGRIIAEPSCSLFTYPEFSFYNFTKSGNLSAYARFSVNIWPEDTDAEVKQKLRNLFTVVEKENTKECVLNAED